MAYWNGTAWMPDVSDSRGDQPRYRRRLFGAALESALIVTLVFGLIAGAAVAAPGGDRGGNGSKGPKNSVTVTVADGTFGTSHTALVSEPGVWIKAMCYQGSTWVYGQYVQSDDNGQASVQLGPTSWWTGGSATCSAEAGSWSPRNGAWIRLGSAEFTVAG